MRYPKRTQYKHAKKPYRVHNWRAYEAGLRARGDLTIWFSDNAIMAWRPEARAAEVANVCTEDRHRGRAHRSNGVPPATTPDRGRGS